MSLLNRLTLAISLVTLFGCATTRSSATRTAAPITVAPVATAAPHACYIPRASLWLPSEPRQPIVEAWVAEEGLRAITALSDDATAAFDCRNGVAAGVLRLSRAAQIAHDEVAANRITSCIPELQRLVVLIQSVRNLGPTQADQIPVPLAELQRLAVYAASPVCQVPGTPSINDVLM